MIDRTQRAPRELRKYGGQRPAGAARSSRHPDGRHPDGWFHALAETVAGGVVAIDRQGNIRSFNAAAEAMTGFTASEVIGRPWHTLLPDVPPDRSWRPECNPVQVRTRLGELRCTDLRIVKGGALPDGGQVMVLTPCPLPDALRPERAWPDADEIGPDGTGQNGAADRHWLWATDAAHRISDISEGFSAVTGCPAGNLLGMPFEKLAALFGNEPAWQAQRDAMDRQQPIAEQRFRVRERGGAYRLFCLSGQPYRSAAGAFAGYHGVICDITAQYRSHQEEQRRSEQLWGAIEACAAALVLFDPGGRLAVHNRAFAELFFPDAPATVRPGLTYEAFARAYIETHLGITSPDSIRECVGLELARHRKGGRPVLRRLADQRWVCSVDTPLPDGSVIGVHVDISAFISREITCRERDRHLLGIVQHLAGAIVTTDLDGRIDFINASALRLFGYAAYEVVGRPIDMLVPDRPRPAARPPQRDDADRQPHPLGAGIFAATGRRKDGTVLDLEVMRSEMRVGEQCHLLRVIRDLTPARQPPGGVAVGNAHRSDLVA